MSTNIHFRSEWPANRDSRVSFDLDSLQEKGAIAVNLSGAGRVNLTKAQSLALRDFLVEAFPVEAPKDPFAVGARVRLIDAGGDRSSRAKVGDLATIEKVGENGFEALLTVRFDDGHTSNRIKSRFEPFVAQEAGDPTGEIVYVTGDSDDWGHTFPVGTAVRITSDDLILDGSYYVETLDEKKSDYVGANDLDVEEPFEPIPVGTFVRITSDGTERGAIRHYLPVGSIAQVQREAIAAGSTYVLRGVCVWPERSAVDTQSVTASSFEVAE